MIDKVAAIKEIKAGLNNLKVGHPRGSAVWTRSVKTKLCKIGRGFGYEVGASDVKLSERDYGEWLYDVTWRKYAGSPSNLVSAPLAAECEWHGEGNVRDDFDKLLLAQANLRLMIFYGGDRESSEKIVRQLASKVFSFKAPPRWESWLLAAWEGNPLCWDSGKGEEAGICEWRFRYFRIGAGGIQEA